MERWKLCAVCAQGSWTNGKLKARIASSIVWLVCACQGCPQQKWALARRVSFGGSTLTVLVEPGEVAISISRRELWPKDGRSFPSRCSMHEPRTLEQPVGRLPILDRRYSRLIGQSARDKNPGDAL
jgi:hypothetical protein